MKRLTTLGLILTAIWVFVFGAIIVFKREPALDMGLNELGDFLAGFSAPLALLWLVIGYFQQGEELRLNTEALKAQQEQLRRQVEETAVLAKNAARQAAAAETLAQQDKDKQESEALKEIAEAQPNFRVEGGSTSSGVSSMKLYNRGGEARDISLDYSGQYDLSISPTHLFERDQQGSLTLKFGGGQIDYPVDFVVEYTDRFGERQSRPFQLASSLDLREADLEKQLDEDE